MKKSLLLPLVLVILLTVLSAAGAEAPAVRTDAEAENLPADLFDLWDYGGESPVWLCNAIPVSDGVLLAPMSAADVPTDQLVISDGTNAWEVKAVIPDETEDFITVFYEPAETAPVLGCWPILPYGESVAASSCTVRFGDSMGSRIIRGILDAEQISLGGRRCYLLTLSDQAPTGSPVLTADGQLAGIVIGQWAEGINRVVALTTEEIARSMLNTGSLLVNLPPWGETPQGLAVTADKNLVTIDWTGMTLPEKAEGQTIWMVLMDTGNSYLNSVPAEGNRTLTCLLTPGRYYLAGPVVSAGRPRELPEAFASFYVPKTGQLTAYGFTPVQTCLAMAPEEGLKKDEAPVPVTEVTEEMLRSGRVYFLSHSTYEVTGQIQGTLLVTLTDPYGCNYRYESSWLYAPEYNQEDIWYLSLKDTGLTAALDRDGYPAGYYQMAFYVDGQLADAFTFELKTDQEQ